MPRTILFRGKTISSERWVYGDLLHKTDGKPYIFNHNENKASYEVMPETKGQYIGESDKTKAKIFEDDILAMDSWSPKNVWVRFIEGAFCLCNAKGEYIGDIHYIHHADRPQATVIGNVHDNKELLSE